VARARDQCFQFAARKNKRGLHERSKTWLLKRGLKKRPKGEVDTTGGILVDAHLRRGGKDCITLLEGRESGSVTKMEQNRGTARLFSLFERQEKVKRRHQARTSRSGEGRGRKGSIGGEGKT